MQWIIRLIIISLTAGWLVLSLLLFIFQSSLICFPDKVVHSALAAQGLPHEDSTLVAVDGLNRFIGQYFRREATYIDTP
ncbi:MAG: hypothetical protein IT528_01845 [Nitrosomonas sp.]|nr:hypothetical protein [Nitrosomonas sp.]